MPIILCDILTDAACNGAEKKAGNLTPSCLSIATLLLFRVEMLTAATDAVAVRAFSNTPTTHVMGREETAAVAGADRDIKMPGGKETDSDDDSIPAATELPAVASDVSSFCLTLFAGGSKLESDATVQDKSVNSVLNTLLQKQALMLTAHLITKLQLVLQSHQFVQLARIKMR